MLQTSFFVPISKRGVLPNHTPVNDPICFKRLFSFPLARGVLPNQTLVHDSRSCNGLFLSLARGSLTEPNSSAWLQILQTFFWLPSRKARQVIVMRCPPPFVYMHVCMYVCSKRLITGYYAYLPSTPKFFRTLGGRSPIDGNQWSPSPITSHPTKIEQPQTAVPPWLALISVAYWRKARCRQIVCEQYVADYSTTECRT